MPVPDDAGEDSEPEEQSAEGTLEIYAIDVEQADATLLIGPEKTMLTDTGDWCDNDK